MSNQYPCTKFSCGSDFEQWCARQEHPNKNVLDGISQDNINEWNCKGASICVQDGELRLCDKDGNKLSGVDICKSDGVTIERGADGSMCVVGIKNSNTGGIVKLWLGTIEQYNASITVPNPNYIYWVTDMSMAQIISNINSLLPRMSTAESNIAELTTKVNNLSGLQNTVTGIGTNVSQLNTKVTNIENGTTPVPNATNANNLVRTVVFNGEAKVTDVLSGVKLEAGYRYALEFGRYLVDGDTTFGFITRTTAIAYKIPEIDNIYLDGLGVSYFFGYGIQQLAFSVQMDIGTEKTRLANMKMVSVEKDSDDNVDPYFSEATTSRLTKIIKLEKVFDD